MTCLLVVCTSCGRVDFASFARDACAVIDAPPITIVQTPSTLISTGVPAALPLKPTQAGDLLVVVTANVENPSDSVLSITDDASNSYISAGTRYTNNGQAVGEIWYAIDSAAGATTLTVNATALTMREIWFVEAVGAGALDVKATVVDLPRAATVSSPMVTPLTCTSLVVAQMTVSDSVSGPVAGPFVDLGSLHGDGTAYAIASTIESYSAVWPTDTPGVYSGATIAFRATP